MQCLVYILLVVTFHVIFQVSFLLCRIITKLTTKRFFSCMNHCMPFSTVIGIENHGTMLTAKLFGAQSKWSTLKTIKPCINTKVYLEIYCRLQDNFSEIISASFIFWIIKSILSLERRIYFYFTSTICLCLYPMWVLIWAFCFAEYWQWGHL